MAEEMKDYQPGPETPPEHTPEDSQHLGGSEGMTFDQWLDSNPAFRSEFDRRNTKAVQTARDKWERDQAEEQDEAKKLSKMSEAQRERYQLDKDKKAFAAQQAQFAAEQMRVTVGAELQKRGLSAEFARFLAGKTAEESSANLDAFQALWDKGHAEQVKAQMRGQPPREPKSGEAYTPEKLKTMSRAEINANWDAISQAMSRQKG